MIWLSRRVALLSGFVGLVIGPGLSACGGTPPPRTELTAAEVAVGEAEEARAAEHASGSFTLAQDKLARARAAVEEQEFVTARRLAEQAEVDAQLAEAEARSEVARARAAELRESIRILEEEIERQRSPTS